MFFHYIGRGDKFEGFLEIKRLYSGFGVLNRLFGHKIGGHRHNLFIGIFAGKNNTVNFDAPQRVNFAGG